MVNSKDGTVIAVDRVGSGPSVVCVGGALNDRKSTASVAALLADRFTVYSYDRRGRGDSGDTQPYSVEREIEDLAAVVEEAGGSAMAYGMSSGAILVLRAAAAGVPLTRIALYEPPFKSGIPGAPAAPPDYSARVAADVEAGRPGDALELFMVAVVGMPAGIVAGMRRLPMWSALEALAPSLRYDGAVAGDGSIPPVAGVAVPVTVLAGTASPDWMRAAAHAVAAAVPYGISRELPKQTHNVDPGALAKELAIAFG